MTLATLDTEWTKVHAVLVGCTVIDSGFMAASTTQSKQALSGDMRESLVRACASIAGTPDVVCLRARTLANTSKVHASMSFSELF